MSIEVTIYCDGCGILGETKRPERLLGKHYLVKPHSLRRELESKGWSCSKKGGLDYCNDCVRDGVKP